MKVTTKKNIVWVLGVGGLVVLILWLGRQWGKNQPLATKAVEPKWVSVMALQKTAIAPQIQGYGRVTVWRDWQGIAPVGGRVIYRHPDLEKGHFLPKDTLVIRIDPDKYQRNVLQLQASLRGLFAKRRQIDRDEANIERDLALENDQLSLAKKAWDRSQSLRERGVLSAAKTDQDRQNYLNARQRWQNLKNKQSGFPSQRDELQSQIEQETQRLTQAKADLAETDIRLPFTGQIQQVMVQNRQWLSPQSTLLTLNDSSAVRVTVPISLKQWRTLALPTQPIALEKAFSDNKRISAVIQLAGDRWQGKVVRVEDALTRGTQGLGVVVEIFQNDNTVPLPPLDSLVSVTIQGQSRSQWVVPESTLHQDRLYFLSNEKLKIVPVQSRFRVQQNVVVEGDIPPDPQLILSDLQPAIEGTLLKAHGGDRP